VALRSRSRPQPKPTPVDIRHIFTKTNGALGRGRERRIHVKARGVILVEKNAVRGRADRGRPRAGADDVNTEWRQLERQRAAGGTSQGRLASRGDILVVAERRATKLASWHLPVTVKERGILDGGAL